MPRLRAQRELCTILAFQVCLQRVGCVAQVLAADHAHQRREQPEGALWRHLEFVVYPRGVCVRGEAEPVAALERLDVRDDPDPHGWRELLQLLHNLAKAAQLPLESRAVADRPVIEPARGADGAQPGKNRGHGR